MVELVIINLSYLFASVLFILGLKKLSHPRTAVRGNLYGAIGMLIAIVVTLFDKDVFPKQTWWILLSGAAIGSLIGAVGAYKVKMTSMPEMVALFNGFGGLASTLVAGAALLDAVDKGMGNDLQVTISSAASGLIGAVTLWGSLVAFGKLYGLKIVPDRPVRYPGEQIVKVALLALSIFLTVMIVKHPENMNYYIWMNVVGSLLGILLVVAIGGADMPVVIALMNSYSGIAAAATGFVLTNNVLIVSGSLVGASGIILTQLMCKAMNRSLANVLFGGFGAVSESASADEVYGGKIKSVSPDDVAIYLDTASKICIVPGYGMAVGQAQHAVKDLTTLLESQGKEVDFAIHPVAGRMPGHMNVLLAEVDIPYDKLKEMDEINPAMGSYDVAIVLGANDVVNPDGRTNPKSVIAGMPIIDVDKAKTVIVIKRSLSPGFAGIPNPLFALDNSFMYFADGKKAILDLVVALKNLVAV